MFCIKNLIFKQEFLNSKKKKFYNFFFLASNKMSHSKSSVYLNLTSGFIDLATYDELENTCMVC